MKTKSLAPLAAILLCAFAHAETKTWTGNAGTFDYATADNWNPAGIPAETDDVIIDGAAVTYNGSGRILSYGDYGDLTDVYEYIGTDDDLANPANWAKDKSAPTPAAPVAGTDIRWFGRNADYSGRLSITDRDRFDGATLRLTDDCNVSSGVAFSNSTVSIATIVVTDPVILSLYGTDLATTRADQWLGVYPPGVYPGAADKRLVNFLPGKASSFTFVGGNVGVSDAATAKSVLVAPGHLVLDGAPITDDQWDAFFDVSVSGTSVTETGATPYNLTLAYWEPFPARTVRNWTIQTGARVKLDRTFPSAA